MKSCTDIWKSDCTFQWKTVQYVIKEPILHKFDLATSISTALLLDIIIQKFDITPATINIDFI